MRSEEREARSSRADEDAVSNTSDDASLEPAAGPGSADPADQTHSEDGTGAALQAELDNMRDRYLRLAAEYDNFRKRTDRERTEGRHRAQGEIVEKMLEPLDDLQRFTQMGAENTSVDGLLEGLRMVERKFFRALEASGLEVLDARGQPFNPELHEALVTTTTDSPEEDDTVGEVFQSGYRFRGMLLRPARVQVRKHDG